MSETTRRSRMDRRRRRPRWAWVTSGILAVLAMAGILVAAFQWGPPWWMEEGDRNHTYAGPAGSLRYQVHRPPQPGNGAPLPVVVALHGCGMTGYGWNPMKATTQLNRLADREGFLVVYPTQRLFRSAINCWNSADPREQHRYRGEPALLAEVAGEVVQEYGADPDQVHVAGASSGAGTAVILAATYPDVFATATSVAGGEYGLNQVDPEDPGAMPPDYTALQAWSQMGDRARTVPLPVLQGDADPVVPSLVATRLVAQWTAVHDLVDDGLLNGSLDLRAEVRTVPSREARHAYAHTVQRTPDGRSVVELYLVRDMEHVWPGPAGEAAHRPGRPRRERPRLGVRRTAPEDPSRGSVSNEVRQWSTSTSRRSDADLVAATSEISSSPPIRTARPRPNHQRLRGQSPLASRSDVPVRAVAAAVSVQPHEVGWPGPASRRAGVRAGPECRVRNQTRQRPRRRWRR